MYKTKVSRLNLALVASALSLAACGGGGSSSAPSSSSSAATTTSANAVASTVSGYVAYGKPVAGASVYATDVNGNSCGGATTAGDGSYSMSTTCAPGPVLFSVLQGAPNGIPLEALAIPSSDAAAVVGTVNLTPLTTMVLYDFLGTQTVMAGVNSPNGIAQTVGFVPTIESAAYQLYGPGLAFLDVSGQYQTAQDAVMVKLASTLAQYGVIASSFNPVTSSFTPNGQGMDAFFDAYPETVTGANNLQLGANNPVVSVTFSGSTATATLGGAAAASTTSSGGSSATSAGANGACTSATFCGRLLGKTITLSEVVQPSGTPGSTQYTENCSGTVASAPTLISSLGAQGALISGTCSVGGQTTTLSGYVLPTPLDPSSASYNADPVSTADGLGYTPDTEWAPAANAAVQATSAPLSFTVDSVTSINAVSGTLLAQ
jgi:hypothetical protein